MSRSAPMRKWLVVVAATVASLVASTFASGPASAAPSPNTIIDSKPPAASASTSAVFVFHSTRNPATFTCRLDTPTWTTCASPMAYNNLAQGSHTFSVRATSRGSTDRSPATWTWVVDTVAPSTPTNLAATLLTAASVGLTWTASTDAGGVTGYDVFRDGALLVSVGAVTAYTDSTVSAGSTYAYAVRARDAAGNVSALSTGTSVTVPITLETFIDSAPPAGTASTSATFTFHSDPVGATFTCKVDAGTAAGCSSPQDYTSLAQGLHSFTVFATMGADADPTPATAAWTVDTTAPAAPTGLAASAPSSTSVQLSWTAATDNLGVTGYDVFRDGALLASIGAVTTWTDGTVPDGTTPAYTLQAFDIAGNRSPLTPPVSAPPPPAALHPALTRMPYLTDLVGLNAIVNFATDQTGPVASVSFGPVSGGSCSLTTTVAATRNTISLNGIYEYQWKASLVLPAAGSWCYRAYLGVADLLGTNPSPVFQTQVPVGSTEPFSFAVFGDWGEVDAAGANPYQAGVMSQVAASGARFAITTGDNGYPSGSQGDYGDLRQVKAGIFGMPFWGGVGSSLAIFPVIGNHGFARSDAFHPHLVNWPQDVAVATSGGRNQVDPYPSINGSTPANLPSSWYAFSAGNARFYMLTATWTDSNVGSGSVYGNDYLAHWTTSSPEYQWLQADLAAHPSGLKFAFFHYPLYSDQPSETGDTYLQGNSSLEGLLASNGVNLAFNGHAHIYQRNAAASGPGRLGLVSYLTGGGGGRAQSTGSCSAIDQYALGWSYTKSRGTACGAAPIPTSPAQVHHFLKVTVAGSTVTVTPIDSTGTTFDVQTYAFTPRPDTFIDSGPVAGTASTSATFTFHSDQAGATFTCSLDGGAAAPCSSPMSYAGLSSGSHTFAVHATVDGAADPLPATWTWTIDATPPDAPTGFAASPTSPFSVDLTWTAAIDNVGVTGYDVFRDGQLLATIAPAISYTDTAVLGASTHGYAVRARDVAGNLSGFTPTIDVLTPPPPVPVFVDGFESGDLTAWDTSAGLVVQGTEIHGGSFAAEGIATTAGPWARKTLPGSYGDAYARTWFLVKSQTSQVNLLRMRTGTASIGYAYITTNGQLAFHNDATNTNTVSTTIPGPGWHALELHVLAAGSGGGVDIWLDNVRIAGLSGAVTTSASPISVLQVGEANTANQVYDVVFDDVAFGTARLGPVADGPPSVPANLAATATAFSVALTWVPSTDDTAVAGYDVFRDGALLAGLVPTPGYTDTTVLASTPYSYAVRARDTSGNLSAQTAPLAITTLAPPVPVFADGFESGDLSVWSTNQGLVAQTSDVRTGLYAAEGIVANAAAYARRSLPVAYADAYARVVFKVRSMGTGSQVTLLRLREPFGGLGPSIGYVYLTSTGTLYFRADAAAAGLPLGGTPGPGWHALEMHLVVNGASSIAEVWLDGALVGGLPATVDLGTATLVGQIQVGDTAGVTADIVFDDAAFGTSRLGPTADGLAPSIPTNLAWTTPLSTSVGLTWTASTDDVGIAGYDLFRDGSPYQALGDVLAFTDTVAAGSTHEYAVRARDTSGNRSALSEPVTATTVLVDGPPTVPSNVLADAPTPYAVNVTWDASTDEIGIAGYDVYRDGALLASLGNVLAYTDVAVRTGWAYQYAVLARDGTGHVSVLSAPATATTPPAPAPVFADGFESGDLAAWTSSAGLVVQPTDVRTGAFAAEGNTTVGNTRATKVLGATYSDAYARVGFLVKSQVDQVNLLRLRADGGTSIGYLYLTTAGRLALRNDVAASSLVSTLIPGPGWHVLELHLGINGTSSIVEVWLDGTLVSDLSSSTANLGTTPVGQFQVGEVQAGRTYDVVYDDAAFGTARIGL